MEKIKKTNLSTFSKIEYPKLLYSLVLIAVLSFFGGMNKLIPAVVLVAFIPLMFDPEYLIGPVFYSCMWNGHDIFTSGQTFARYFIIFFIFSVVVNIIQKNRRIKVDFWFITVVLGILLALMLSAFGVYGYTSIPASYILNLMLFLVALYCPVKSKDLFKKQLWYFAILSLIYTTWFVLRNGFDAFEEGKLGSIDDVNTNGIGKILCIIAIVVFCHFLASGLQSRILHISMLLVSVLLLFLSGSRTSLLAFLIAAVICLLYWMKLNSRKIIGTVIVIALVLLLFSYIYDYLVEAYPVLMERFTVEDTLEDGGTGRVAVWASYMTRYFPKYFMFGMGFDPLNLFRAIESVNGIGHGAHNHIIDILASTGVVGLALYIPMHIKGCKEGMQLAKRDAFAMVPFGVLIATLAIGIGENILRGRLLWFSVALIMLLKKLNEQEYANLEGAKNK